jgi:hypothetical protein
MSYHFDNWGWFTTEVIPGRSTEIAPPDDLPEGKQANWTGHAWKILNYSAPPVYTPPEPEVVEVSKVAWRRRFTAAEQDAIDAFNEGGYLTHPALDEATKGVIRRGLVLYSVTININPLDPDTQALLGLYEMLGLLAPGRAAEIGVA